MERKRSTQQHMRTDATDVSTLSARPRPGIVHAQQAAPGNEPATDAVDDTRGGDAAVDALVAHNRRISRALRTLSAGNRTLLRETDESSLLEAMCRVAVVQGAYLLAMVNYACDDDAKTVRTMAHYGSNDGFIESLNLTWDDTERGQGSVGTAIRSGAHCIFRSTSDDLRFRPWRDEAARHGFQSLISLALRVDDVVIGTFTLLAGEEDAFDQDEVALLDELAADLSFGIGIIRSRVRQAEVEEIARRALTEDAVTGLLNRSSFLVALSDSIASCAGTRNPLAVLVVRLTRLQEIYDGLGYDPGLKVLREFGRRLKAAVGATTTVARLQSDEFGVFLPAHDAPAAARVARDLQASLGAPILVDQVLIDAPATIGSSFYPGHGDDAELLLRRSGIAARDAATAGMRYSIYQGSSHRENPERLALAAELRRGIDQRELILNYQPKIDLASGRIVGSEALVRWMHPKRGLIAPMAFIPIAEETGLIREMTYGIVEAAIRQQHAWVRQGVGLPIAVNLSVRNLYDPGFIPRLNELVSTWGIDHSLIDFEITESALADDPETARQTLALIGRRGSSIYIDDFGTGYSSLNYLVSLPVHFLKIDRCFVSQMTSNRQARAIVASVISMAHNLGLRVVAEGVETSAEAEMLTDMGCDQGQGYVFHRPLSVSEYEALFA